jgi:tetratricopeptide (TPR) repeat protein
MTESAFHNRQAIKRATFIRLLIAVLIIVYALGIPHMGFAAYQASSDAEQQERFNTAVQAFTKNNFTDARTLFEGVRGSHSEEAKAYLGKIKSYKEAMELADKDMQRSPDELDVGNLDFAIGKYQEAIAIKSDGPWDPKAKLEKATSQRARLVQQSGPSTEARKRNLCDKMLKASAARTYDQAKYMACALANDEPGYSCGGYEAVYLCKQMEELAKMGPRPSGNGPKLPEALPTQSLSDGKQKDTFEKAKAAFDANDFDGARIVFQRVVGDEKAAAQEYLQRIGQYQNSMKQAAKLSQDGKYEEARASYQDAAKIKPDGPGNPQDQTGLMTLQLGISEFYGGNYTQASDALAAYVQDNTQKADVAHFYMGACVLARFFLGGSQDGSLREQALSDFRKAKEAGFHPKNLEVSPKIMKAYDDL